MESLHVRKSGLPPVVDENTEILILGTLPSDMSLAAEQYYANPGNDFWKLVGAALNQNLDGLSYEDKLELLKANRIGLWDAFHSCIRPGSMDSDIAEQELNDFETLKSIAPNIRLICFNGQRAAEAEETLTRLEYQTRLLPSSSPANRNDQRGRLVSWKAAIQFTTNYFNKKYGLTPEPVLDDADLLSPDFLSSSFVRVDTGTMPSLGDVQSALAQILLIPQVPESVRRTFQIAMRLYLFGRFEYGFFTVSDHYAFLAIEAAILSGAATITTHK
jgi:TDG/mug DNA glycosylase family protein